MRIPEKYRKYRYANISQNFYGPNLKNTESTDMRIYHKIFMALKTFD
jgi:hypothetical protein